MKRVLLSALFAAALVLSATGAGATASRQFSYQGVLTDDAGVLVPDGAYDLTVRLYGPPPGNALVFIETHTGVPVAKGGFSILVGSIQDMADLDMNAQLSLSLQVGANPEMTPRVALGAAPYAMGLTLPAFLTDSSSFGLLWVRNKGTGPGLVAEGTAQLGSENATGRLVLKTPATGAAELAALQHYGPAATPYGGELRMNKANGLAYSVLEPDVTGDGGFFSVYRTGSTGGFTVDGNNNNNSPLVTIAGASATTSFNGGVTGDAAAEFPVGSILANEIGDEPGVAHAASGAFHALTGSVESVTSRTITVPQAGYVVAIASSELRLSHVNGDAQALIVFSVDNVVPGSIVDDVYTVFELPSTAPTGEFRTPASVTGVFPVSAGANTFYVLAQEVTPGGSEGYTQNPNLTLMYFPTGYGTVTPTMANGAGDKSRPAPALTSADIADEQAEARRFDDDRLRRELESMQAKLDELRRQMASGAQGAQRMPE
jgi:hypothetical protein